MSLTEQRAADPSPVERCRVCGARAGDCGCRLGGTWTPMLEPSPDRTQPYTARGITRMACSRCGRRSYFQWTACACASGDGRTIYHPLCIPCDIELNEHTLQFFCLPDADERIAEYRRRSWEEAHATGYCNDFPGECTACASEVSA